MNILRRTTLAVASVMALTNARLPLNRMSQLEADTPTDWDEVPINSNGQIRVSEVEDTPF